MDPLVIRFERLGPQPLAGDEQHVGPFVRPVIDEFRPREQRIDQPIALVGGGVGQEGAGFVGGRQRADRVEKGAAQECRVVARRRRRNAQGLQLCQHQLVDEIPPRRGGESFGRKLR